MNTLKPVQVSFTNILISGHESHTQKEVKKEGQEKVIFMLFIDSFQH